MAVWYRIIEKVLAQNRAGLNKIQQYVGHEALAWVKTPRRIYPWYQAILERLNSETLTHIRVIGSQWGLACNAIHFIDLMAWCSGKFIKELETTRLETSWFRAKRAGNWEISGTLSATFTGDTSVDMISNKSGSEPLVVEIFDGNGLCQINEDTGIATFADRSKIYGCIPHQSEITGSLVDQILITGRCQLPNLNSSIAIHGVFIDSMLDHWRRSHNRFAEFIPIT